MKTLNLVGQQIRKLRYEHGLTQDALADRLQKAGWMISRSGVSKIESGSIYVHEFRLYYFAYVFGLPNPTALMPKLDLSKPIHETMLRFIHNEQRGMTEEADDLDSFNPALFTTKENRF
jgi:transcriptional regulator with XRE-family HTH domain